MGGGAHGELCGCVDTSWPTALWVSWAWGGLVSVLRVKPYTCTCHHHASSSLLHGGMVLLGVAIAERLAPFKVKKFIYTDVAPRPELASIINAEYGKIQIDVSDLCFQNRTDVKFCFTDCVVTH